jgi:hypothetical protein
MNRNRLRSEVERTFLALIAEIACEKFDPRRLTILSFAASAGLSRQALYSSHSDIAFAIKLLAKGLIRPHPRGAPSPDLANLREERDVALGKLKGAVEQNHELCVEIMLLKEQLSVRGLTVVKP